ncbi:MAG TPA: SRPBCC domain-containing protein, partial [Puia sp.]|nr:SRPBCC domain-containing protein [Puia sp.]
MKTQEITKSSLDNKTSNDFTYVFESSKSPKEIYETLLDARDWWSGLYAEKFKGKTDQLNEEFSFSAGQGMHFTKQKLVEIIQEKKIAWLVVESNLSFLKNPEEWTGTKICFEILSTGSKTQVKFTHVGLVTALEAYKGCASAWTQYLENLS